MGMGWTHFIKSQPNRAAQCASSSCCIIFCSITGSYNNASSVGSTSGTNPKKAKGACTLFTAVDKTKPLKHAPAAVSGGSMYAGPPSLYSSWPASSVHKDSCGELGN